MRDGGGKGLRVTGFFLLLLGCGVILDSDAEAIGAATALCGVALFAWGVVRISARGRTEVPGATAEGSERC